jgi:hypothetical protein
MGFYPVAVELNKTQHINTHITQNTTPRSNETQHTKKSLQTIKDTLHTMNKMQENSNYYYHYYLLFINEWEKCIKTGRSSLSPQGIVQQSH